MTQTETPECWCGKPAERNGNSYRSNCAAHRQRQKRKKRREGVAPKPLGRPRLHPAAPIEEKAATPLQAVERVALKLADASAEMSEEKFAFIRRQLDAAIDRAVEKRKARKSNAAPTRSTRT